MAQTGDRSGHWSPRPPIPPRSHRLRGWNRLGTLIVVRIGVLTGGGDCPGLNAVIRAVVRKGAQAYGDEFVGFRDGWRGPLEGDTMSLDVAAVRGILPRGGTILGSSRTNPLSLRRRRTSGTRYGESTGH